MTAAASMAIAPPRPMNCAKRRAEKLRNRGVGDVAVGDVAVDDMDVSAPNLVKTGIRLMNKGLVGKVP